MKRAKPQYTKGIRMDADLADEIENQFCKEFAMTYSQVIRAALKIILTGNVSPDEAAFIFLQEDAMSDHTSTAQKFRDLNAQWDSENFKLYMSKILD